MFKSAATLLLLCALCPPGWALKCYSCNSDKVPACADPPSVSSINLHDCSLDKNAADVDTLSCIKVVTEDGSAKTNVTRKCMSHVKAVDPCKMFSVNLKAPYKVQSCDVCGSDACNGAGLPALSTVPVLAGVLAAVARLRFHP